MRSHDAGAFVGHHPCPCGKSSDGLAVYAHDGEDGPWYDGACFACERSTGKKKYFKLDDDFQPEERKVSYPQNVVYQPETPEFVASNYRAMMLADRGLRADVLDYYGVKVSVDQATGAPNAHYYPVYARNQLVGYKKRSPGKIFSAIGATKGAQLFGQWLWPDGAKTLVITEGELDALAAYQMTLDTNTRGNYGWRSVSLPTGAGVDAVKRELEWIESYEKVILCLDNDTEGKDATNRISELLSPGKAHIVQWSEHYKDSCDMLLAGQKSEFLNMLFRAAPHTPAGIVSGADTWQILQDRPTTTSVPYPNNWNLNDMTYGIRLGELDTWTSGSGSGKTQVMRELQFHLLAATEANVGIIALEEPLPDTIEGLMALYLNKRIHLPDVDYTQEEYVNSWRYCAGSNRIHLYDHWGSSDAETLFNKIRYLAKGLDCKYIFLDHLSIVVSEFAGDGDERRQIDTIMSKLKMLTQELHIWIGLVVHLRKTSGSTSFEEGAVPSTDDLRGSGSIKQLSNGVYAIARNQQAADPYFRNTSSVHSLKCRFTGRTGAAGWLHFDEMTGRMIPVGDPLEELQARTNAAEAEQFANAQAGGYA